MGNFVAKTNVMFDGDTSALERAANRGRATLGEYASDAEKELGKIKSATNDILGSVASEMTSKFEGVLKLVGHGGGIGLALGALGVGLGYIASVIEDQLNRSLERSNELADEAAAAFRKVFTGLGEEAVEKKDIPALKALEKEATKRANGLQQRLNALEKYDLEYGSGYGENDEAIDNLRKQAKQATDDATKMAKDIRKIEEGNLKDQEEAEAELWDKAFEEYDKEYEAINKNTDAIKQQNRVKLLGAAEAARVEAYNTITDKEQLAVRLAAIDEMEKIDKREKAMQELEALRKAGPDKITASGRAPDVSAILSTSNEGLTSLSRAMADREAEGRDREAALRELQKFNAKQQELIDTINKNTIGIVIGGGGGF